MLGTLPGNGLGTTRPEVRQASCVSTSLSHNRSVTVDLVTTLGNKLGVRNPLNGLALKRPTLAGVGGVGKRIGRRAFAAVTAVTEGIVPNVFAS